MVLPLLCLAVWLEPSKGLETDRGLLFEDVWGVFQKAGYVAYPGMFEDKRADNLSFRFQNRR